MAPNSMNTDPPLAWAAQHVAPTHRRWTAGTWKTARQNSTVQYHLQAIMDISIQVFLFLDLCNLSHGSFLSLRISLTCKRR
jgi:hypothetical protein